MSIELQLKNRNPDIDGFNIYRSTTRFDRSTLPGSPLASLGPTATTYLDDTALVDVLYYYAVEVVKGSETALSPIQAIKDFSYTGPGPDAVLRGDHEAGFWGTIPAVDITTATQLKSLLALSGTLDTEPDNWLKISFQGNILLIPDHPRLMHSISWEDLYQAGAVYGTGDVGVYPSGGDRIQDASLTVGDATYRIRLPKLVNNTFGHTDGSDYTSPDNPEMEWSELRHVIWPSYLLGVSGQARGNWYSSPYTTTTNFLGMERLGSAGNTLYGRQAHVTVAQYNPISSSTTTYWMPVLELEI